MEEKKLTDEEIARAILQQIEYNAGIPYIDEWLKVKTVQFADILNFIYRLQQRVSILEADNDDYKMKLAENELVSIDWHNEQVGHLEEENAELQKQAVKYTAKEIIQWIKRNGTLQYGGYVIHDSTIEQMCKKYGVEVE